MRPHSNNNVLRGGQQECPVQAFNEWRQCFAAQTFIDETLNCGQRASALSDLS